MAMVKEYKGKKKQETDYVATAARETSNRPPQAPEIEEAVIGAMMVDSECVHTAIESLTERTYQQYQQVVINRNNHLIFNALRTYQNVLNTA